MTPAGDDAGVDDAARSPRRHVLYGGTFDPMHAGHAAVAAGAVELLGADVLSLIPAADPPHKSPARADSRHRLAMCRLVAAALPRVEVLDVEIRRGGRSYTIDTVLELQAGECRGDDLMLLVGADSVPMLPTWHRIDELLRLVPMAVAPRPGAEPPDWPALERSLGRAACTGLRSRWLPTPRHEISSTAVRRRAAEGRSIRCWVPDEVADYVEAHGLYRPQAEAARPPDPASDGA